MEIGSKGRVIGFKGKRALVDIDGKRRSVDVREDVEVNIGDKVVVFLDAVVAKL